MNIACSNCKYWLRLAEASGECRRRAPAVVVGETAPRWPVTSPGLFCWEWRPTEEAQPKAVGRPVLYTRETMIEALSCMTPDEAPRTFDQIHALLRAKHPTISKPTAYKFLNALCVEGWFKTGQGYVRAAMPPEGDEV